MGSSDTVLMNTPGSANSTFTTTGAFPTCSTYWYPTPAYSYCHCGCDKTGKALRLLQKLVKSKVIKIDSIEKFMKVLAEISEEL